MINLNSKSSYLISKSLYNKVTPEIRRNLKRQGIKFSQKTFLYDIIEIGHTSGLEESTTTVMTFRDKLSKILQRNIKDKTKNSTKITQRNYKEKKAYTIDPMDYDGDFIPITRRVVSSVTKENGNYVERSHQVISAVKTNNGKSVVTISEIKNKPYGFDNLEGEMQSLYEYTKGSKRGYRTNGYAKSRYFGILLPKIRYYFENMEDLSNDIFLLLHLYSNKEFKHMGPYISDILSKNKCKGNVYWHKGFPEHQTWNAYCDGDIHLNRRKIKTRKQVIETIAHENEHVQHFKIICEYLKLIDLLKKKAELRNEQHIHDIEKKISELQKNLDEDLAKKYVETYTVCTLPEEDMQQYVNNFIEIKARQAATMYVRDYKRSYVALQNKFPYAADGQIGPCVKEQIM